MCNKSILLTKIFSEDKFIDKPVLKYISLQKSKNLIPLFIYYNIPCVDKQYKNNLMYEMIKLCDPCFYNKITYRESLKLFPVKYRRIIRYLYLLSNVDLDSVYEHTAGYIIEKLIYSETPNKKYEIVDYRLVNNFIEKVDSDCDFFEGVNTVAYYIDEYLLNTFFERVVSSICKNKSIFKKSKGKISFKIILT